MPAAQSYDPRNPTPYTPVQAPEIAPPAPSPISNDPVQANGAVKRSGAIATIADGVLRGFMQGKAMADAKRVMQLKAKSDNLLASYNQDAERLVHLTQAGVNPNSQTYKTAQAAVQGSWGAWMDFMGQHVDQQQQGKKGKGGGKQQQQQGSILDRLRGSDPLDVSAAWYQVAKQAGPPVLSQVEALSTPEAQAARKAQQQAAQTDVTAAQGADVTAQANLEQAKQVLRYSQIAGKPTKDWTTDERAFIEQYDSMHGKPTDEVTRQRSAIGQKVLDDPNYQLTPSEQLILNGGKNPGGAPPKVGTFGDFMRAAYGDNPTAGDYERGRKQWAEAASGTTVGTHIIMVQQRDGTLKAIQVETTSRKEFPGAGGGASGAGGNQGGTPSWIGSAELPPLYVVGGNASKIPGMTSPGNINIMHRPNIPNADTGGDSSVFSTSIGTDKGEVLIPRVSDGKDGKESHLMSVEEATDYYHKYGGNLGTFDTPEHATAYAEKLHQQQSRLGQIKRGGNSPETPPAPAAHAPGGASSPRAGGVAHPGDTVGGRQTPEATKAIELADAAETAYEEAKLRAKNPTPIGDTGIVLNWVKSQIAGAGRMNNLEIEQGLKSGSFETRFNNTYQRAVNGTLDPKFRRQMVDDIAKYAQATAKEAAKYEQPGGGQGGGGGVEVTDPKGKVHHFDTQEQADTFKKLAGIK